jgi:hypothetical protein
MDKKSLNVNREPSGKAPAQGTSLKKRRLASK